jgi:YVTN family beta-propeller protein
MKYVAFLAVIALAVVLVSQPASRELVGPQADGSVLLATGWRIQPVGRQVPVDTFPMSTALSPNGKYLLVLNAGYRPPSISVLDASAVRELERVPVPDAWLGLKFSPNGQMVYVGGGSRGRVFEFTFSAEGKLAPSREFVVAAAAELTHRDFIGDVTLSPDGRLIYAADLYHDQIAVINPQSGRVIDRFKTGRRPYRILFHPDGKSFFVSSWAEGAVIHHDVAGGAELARIRLGPHTTDMVFSDRRPEDANDVSWRARLFVTAANTNNVFVVGLSDSKAMRVVESINIALTSNHPLGMTPSAVALSPDQKRLFTVCSDANAVAVAEIAEPRSQVSGFVPTGWYPTAAHMLADGRLLILNGRGLRSFANPNGPGPIRRAAPLHEGDRTNQYVGYMQTGTISVVDPFDEVRLVEYTRSTLALSPWSDPNVDIRWTSQNNPFFMRPDRPSLIEHVVYIVKENRTYDQVFGKIGKGNSDPSLALFDEQSAPNHFKLAREYVLFDNFYVNADVSADGHNWSTAAIAPDYTQRLWPNSYARRRRHYDYEGQEPANSPPAGYIWTQVLQRGLPMRNYGYFVNNRPKPGPDGVQIDGVRDPALAPHTSTRYRGFDLEYPDVDRAKAFLEEVGEFERSGRMPRFLIMRIGNDHTSGTTPNRIAPLSAMADNDYALGMIIEGLSKTRFWPKTAVFVIEDDAQNGPDHVDSHRSAMFVVSPYTRRGIVDSTMYNQTSVLRTMELMLGLRPMTHFDAGARPITAAFAATPNLQPYAAERPRISLTERNPATSPTAARSARMSFEEADEIDDDELNDILWRAIRKTEPPPPVRSLFAR